MDCKVEGQSKRSPIPDQMKVNVYEAEELFGNSSEFGIMFKNELYRIRITRNGKLIMNK
ncbi:MAG: hemin uptake protein HemP [Sedimentisphaeraceae bacterium JB056]